MIKTAKVRILLSFGILSTVITLAYTLTLQGQSLIIGKIISLEAVAIYAVPVLLMRNARGVLLAPARVFWPRFANLDGKNHQEEIICLFIRGIRLFAIFASGVTLMIFVFGQSFIRLWINETFEAAYPVLLLMAGGFLVEGSQTIMGILLSGTGRQGTRAFFAAFEGLIGFGLSIILTIQFGLVGAALGFVVAVLLIRGLICPWYICRLLRINVLQYFRENILRPWLILFFLTFIFYSIGFNEFISNWLHLIVMAIIIGGTYIGLIYCFAINQGEREAALNFIRRFISLITLNRCRKKAEIPGNVGITSSKDIDV